MEREDQENREIERHGSIRIYWRQVRAILFAEVDAIMARVFDVGSVHVQAAFATNVRAWVTLQTRPVSACEELPEHLEKNKIGGINTSIFRRLRSADGVVRTAKGVEDIVIVVRRKALLELATVYEVIGRIKAAKKLGKSGLLHGQEVPAKARKILYTTLYHGMYDQGRMKGLFEYNVKSASSYVFLQKHYGHDGILAMILVRSNEEKIGVSTRFPAKLEFLDFLFHDIFPRFCSGVIDTLFGGRPLSEETLKRLAWKVSSPSGL